MLSRGTLVLALLGTAACTGDIMGGGGGDDVAVDAAGAVTLTITSPAAASVHARDTLDPGGFLAADVAVGVAVDGAVDTVEIAVGDEVLGQVDDAGGLVALVRGLGPVTLTARALRGGEVVATAEVAVEVVEPEVATCRDWLDLYGLTYTVGPNNQGVADPVTVTTPINGMVHRYISNTGPRATFFMDCSLARSLAKAAPILRAHDIVEVADIGVYNYRCIGGTGVPPDCPNGMSQHAYAKAIDIAGLTDSAGTFYSVEDDWVIDPDSEPTCTAPAEAGADQFLHTMICELKAAGVWNIVLTPNYNADHRDHWHVDLTTGSNYIQSGELLDTGPDDY